MILKPLISLLLFGRSITGLDLRRDRQHISDETLLQTGSESESSTQEAIRAQLQTQLQELVEDEQLIDLSQYNREEQFENLLEIDDSRQGHPWENSFLQIEDTNEDDSLLRIRSKQADEMFMQRLKKQQSLVQTVLEKQEYKLQMVEQLNKLEELTNKTPEQQEQIKLLQMNIQDANATVESTKSQQQAKRVLHIIPHSHTDDLTSNKDIQKRLNEQTNDDLYKKGAPSGFIGSPSDILNSTMLELYQDGNRTFTFGDLKFFKRWYDTLNESDKADVKIVIQNGQLDLVNGGWLPMDEALTQYDSLLDSFQVGQQFLWKEFEYQPRVSWQLDNNGVSQGYARLAKDIGFDLLIFSSVSKQEKDAMTDKQSHTQIWRTSTKNFGSRKDVLAVTLDQGQSALNSYCWPKGFWVDENYMIDSIGSLQKNQSDYKLDDLVKNLYADITERFDASNSSNIFQPFGCDMAFVDAKLNYKIMDKVIEVWKNLSYDKDVEIRYSTPSIFYQSLLAQNEEFANSTTKKVVNQSAESNSTSNSTENETKMGWKIRRDDTFPYQPTKQTFLSGYYSARPHLKKKVREFSQTFHSSLRLLSQQVLRKDLDDKKTAEALQFQTGILESLGNLQSYEAITGSSNLYLSGEYYSTAKSGKKSVEDVNAKLLQEKLLNDYGIRVNKLDSDMKYDFKNSDLISSYSHDNKTLIVVQNPSTQKREELIEIQLPYYNFTIEQVLNNTQKWPVKVEKYLPRVWQNSQKFFVPSLAQFKVRFDNPSELFKVFIVTGLGVIRKPNPIPYNYQFKYLETPKIWNLNLPVFLPKNGWEINNFQSNYLAMLPNMTIKSGSKTLTFLEIVPKRNLKKSSRSAKKEKSETTTKGDTSSDSEESVKLPTGSGSSKDGKKVVEAEPLSTENSTAPLDPQDLLTQNQTNNTSSSDFKSKSYRPLSALSSSSQGKQKKKVNASKVADENEGAAVFLYEDSATGVKQKFAFSLRYYIGAKPVNEPLKKSNSTGLVQLDRKIESGVFDFSANGTSQANQKSYRYGEVNLKRSKRKMNKDSSEFLLVYEQKYGEQKIEKSSTQEETGRKGPTVDKFKEEEFEQKYRAHVRISLNQFENFVKFHVSTNEVPISQDKTGKDVVVDWFLMDGFDTDEKFWVDANGLQMVPKALNQRKEYNFQSDFSVSSNYYPITSAIAVRDFNKSNGEGEGQKQVTIMTDRSQGASAGLRLRKNIEVMHQRRYRRSNSSRENQDNLNELDSDGHGIQVKETYYMQIGTVGKSMQRALQRQIDQPLMIHYSQGYSMPSGQFDSTKSTNARIDLAVMDNITRQLTKEGSQLNRTFQVQSDKDLVSVSNETQNQTVDANKVAEPAKEGKAPKSKTAVQNEDEDMSKKEKDKNQQNNLKGVKECKSVDGKVKVCEHYDESDQSKLPNYKPKAQSSKTFQIENNGPNKDFLGQANKTDNNNDFMEVRLMIPKSNSPVNIDIQSSEFIYEVDNQAANKTLNGTQNAQSEETLKLEDDTYNPQAGVWYNKFNVDFKESQTTKLLVYGVQKNNIMIRVSNLEDRFDGLNAKTYKFDINAWAREFYLEANNHLLAKGNTTSELLRGIRVNITEMNLAGSIPKSFFNSTLSQAKWIAQNSTKKTKEGDDQQIDYASLGLNETAAESQKALDQKEQQESDKQKDVLDVEKEPKDWVAMVDIQRAKGSVKGLVELTEQNYIVSLEPQSIRTFNIMYFMPNLQA